MTSNPHAVAEAITQINKQVDDSCENLEKVEYKEVLEDIIDALKVRLESVDQELEDEGEPQPEDE